MENTVTLQKHLEKACSSLLKGQSLPSMDITHSRRMSWSWKRAILLLFSRRKVMAGGGERWMEKLGGFLQTMCKNRKRDSKHRIQAQQPLSFAKWKLCTHSIQAAQRNWASIRMNCWTWSANPVMTQTGGRPENLMEQKDSCPGTMWKCIGNQVMVQTRNYCVAPKPRRNSGHQNEKSNLTTKHWILSRSHTSGVWFLV